MEIYEWFYLLFFSLCHKGLCENSSPLLGMYDDRVVGGSVTRIHHHPYYAFLNSGCGGSIIERRWILTAGHCKTEDLTTVFVGVWDPQHIKSATRMPLYYKGRGVHHFDYMLLELNSPLVYNPNVQPIQIADESDIVKGKVGTAMGYGLTKENGTQLSMDLRRVKLPILEGDTCRRVHLIYGMDIERNEFCAGYPEGGRDTCKGDSGGPFVVNGRLLGVTSYGKGCARPGIPGVYGSVPYVLSWIRSVTGME